MNTRFSSAARAGIAGLLVSGLLLVGCTSQDESAASAEATAEAKAAEVQTGAIAWAENCTRCHYLRPPESYTEEQWEIIIHHMRIRGGLTANEHRAIIAFLKNGF